MKRVQSSDHLFEDIFHTKKEKVYRFLLSMLKSEFVAEEVTQEVFIKLWVQRDSLETIQNIDAYLYRVTKNQALNHIRQATNSLKIVQRYTAPIPQYEECTEKKVMERDYQELLNRALDQLSPQRKLVYKLSREEGLSHLEIAEQLHVSKNTVKNHLVYTLSFLKDYLVRHGIAVIFLLLCRW